METVAAATPKTAEASTPDWKIKKPALTKILPSDRLAFDRQIEALKAFAAEFEAKGKVTNESAGLIAKLSASTIVVTNAFFCDIQLLNRNQDDDGFTVAPEAISFLHGLHGIAPENAPEKLRPLFERQWFNQVLVPRLRLGAMDVDVAIKHLGEASNAQMEHRQRLEILLQFLVFVGLVRREGNQIRLGTLSSGSEQQAPIMAPSLNLPVPAELEAGMEKYTLTLDPSKKRKFVIHTPPVVSPTELERIKQWLSFQLIVEDK